MTPVIAILGNESDTGLKRAFQDLATALQLQVEFGPATNLSGLAGIVSMGPLPANVPDLPRFQFVSGQQPTGDTASTTLEFASHPELPPVLRRQKVSLGKESGWTWLAAQSQSGDVIATIDSRPVWTIARPSGVPIWTVSTPVPRLEAQQRLAHLLNGETFLPLLPLYLFLRALSPESRWELPPLRACLVVDDPNLHAQTYGHIDYRALARLAADQPFHAAMAMVPRDVWWTNSRAARIFRDNPRALSLLVHGNDHATEELAQSFHNGERDALVDQSLSRVKTWEQNHRMRVDRVMAPPHGVCAPEMFSALRAGGYEGMTTNRWSLWKHNPPSTLPANFGLCPADFFDGLPVVNRFRFKSKICAGEFLIGAVLGQPLIPYGHHQDFADGMTHVHATLKIINSRPVRWMSVREILESNYVCQVEAGVLHVRPFSRRVKVTLPPGVTAVQVHPLPDPSEKSSMFDIASREKSSKVPPQVSLPELPAGAELEIRALDNTPRASRVPGTARKSPALALRRLAAEIRDRLKI